MNKRDYFSENSFKHLRPPRSGEDCSDYDRERSEHDSISNALRKLGVQGSLEAYLIQNIEFLSRIKFVTLAVEPSSFGNRQCRKIELEVLITKLVVNKGFVDVKPKLNVTLEKTYEKGWCIIHMKEILHD